MAHIQIPDEVPVRYLPRSSRANLFWGGLVAVGLLAFVLTLVRNPMQAWRAYVADWLLFASVSMGALILAAATTITKAKWSWSVRRVFMSPAAFLPLAFVLFLPMLTLGADWFPWIEEMAHDPILQNKAAYLNFPFLVARNVILVLLLFGIALYFTYLGLRPDLGLASGEHEGGDEARRAWRARLTADWAGQEREEVRSWQRMKRLAPALVLVYAVAMTFISYDWAMTLEPHWFSTMFGPWFFMGAFWGGVATIALITIYLKRADRECDRLMGAQQLHDLGKLAFAFCVFWAYLFFAQYLVIWYGKLPWEQAWIVHRSEPPWGAWSAAVVVLCFVLPFAGLLGRRPKTSPKILGTFSVVILAGLWLERYLLVAPSLEVDAPPMTVWEPLIGLMFLGLFGWSVRWFLSTFPVVQVWQPPAEAEMVEAEVRDEAGVA
jgi:hypothetical protein